MTGRPAGRPVPGFLRNSALERLRKAKQRLAGGEFRQVGHAEEAVRWRRLGELMRWQVSALAVALVAFASDAKAQSALRTFDDLVAKHATAHGVPEQLVRRVITIESRGNPKLINAGNYGLMQIRLGTARAMGYEGQPDGLLDADTNMTYAVKYLAGAYRAAGCDPQLAISYYQHGYAGAAKGKCTATMQLAGARSEIR